MYEVLRNSIVSFVTDNKHPFGLLADKMTAKHRKRHMIGIRVTIWDVNSPHLNRNIYSRHSVIGYGSGKEIVKHLLHNLESFGLPIPYTRKYLIGMAMGGQYACLNVDDRMNDELQKTVNLSWDPMHRVELVFKDCKSVVNSRMIDNTITVIHETLSLFKTGNNFELLHSEKDVCDTFCVPKIFKDMTFVTSSSEVFKTFIFDFRALVFCLDKLEHGAFLKNKILDPTFLLNVLFLSDINLLLARSSKLVQKSCNLPWEYSKTVEKLLTQVKCMLDQITFINNEIDKEGDKSLGVIIQLLNCNPFPFFGKAAETADNETFQGISVSRVLGPLDHDVLRRGRAADMSNSLTMRNKLKQLLNFAKQYIAVTTSFLALTVKHLKFGDSF